GEREPGRIGDDTRAQAALWDSLGHLAEEAPEELLPEILLERRPALGSGSSRHRVDVDYGGLDGVRDRREGATLGRHLDRNDGDRADGRRRRQLGTAQLRS